MTPPVFLVDALPTGDSALLDGPEGRHAALVRRLRPGEPLLLCDGRGGLAEATVRAPAGREALLLDVHGRRHEPPARPRVVLAQALLKGDRGELAVELATEAGVDEVLPWAAARCVTRWDGARGGKALERWRSTAREAAKQSRRAWLAPVAEPVRTVDLAARVRAGATGLVLHESARADLGEPAAGPLPADGELLLVVGPEGGIADAELAELLAAGARAVRLGPGVLRASTAGAVALGALGVLTGRWGRGRGHSG